jgi:predicted DNA-binding protein (UPF0251 family)
MGIRSECLFSTMARPKKWRRVTVVPVVSDFRPQGVSARDLERVCLTVEELEAMRLKHLEGLHQDECAASMHISRATFQRVLNSAHRKATDALTGGRALCIKGGDFGLAWQPLKCTGDGHEWLVAFEALVSGEALVCPRCGGSAVICADPSTMQFPFAAAPATEKTSTGAEAPPKARERATRRGTAGTIKGRKNQRRRFG